MDGRAGGGPGSCWIGIRRLQGGWSNSSSDLLRCIHHAWFVCVFRSSNQTTCCSFLHPVSPALSCRTHSDFRHSLFSRKHLWSDICKIKHGINSGGICFQGAVCRMRVNSITVSVSGRKRRLRGNGFPFISRECGRLFPREGEKELKRLHVGSVWGLEVFVQERRCGSSG